jgi:hypothetical protein
MATSTAECSGGSSSSSSSGGPDDHFVFFAKVPPSVPASDILKLFSTCGKVVDINLFKPWPSSKSSKVCLVGVRVLNIISGGIMPLGLFD